MAALTQDAHVSHLGTPTKLALPCKAAATFYAGTLCYIDNANTTGYIVATGAATDCVAGIVAKQTTTTAAGDLVEVYVDGVFSLTIGGFTISEVGSTVYADASVAMTNNPADADVSGNTALADNDAMIGVAIAINSEESGQVWVKTNFGYIYVAVTASWVTGQ